jgi:hypothetical protein
MPLLDWTRNPYIAAYFAFVDVPKDSQEVAIYMYQEFAGTGKFTSQPRARIVAQRHGSGFPRRHVKQECEYTVCVKGWPPPKYDDVIFCRHEEIYERRDVLAMEGQDAREKFTLPISEQEAAIRDLFGMGITPHFLFQTLDSMGKTAELKFRYNLLSL